MTRENAKALLPILKAYGDGEDIQYKISDRWLSLPPDPQFNAMPECYRIAPKPREYYVALHPDGQSKILYTNEGLARHTWPTHEIILVREVVRP